MTRSAWTLFVSPACPLCAEAEAVVDARLGCRKRRVLPSSRPGFIVVDAEPEPIEAPASTIPGTPALWDHERNVLHVGLEAIERAIA